MSARTMYVVRQDGGTGGKSVFVTDDWTELCGFLRSAVGAGGTPTLTLGEMYIDPDDPDGAAAAAYSAGPAAQPSDEYMAGLLADAREGRIPKRQL